MTGLCALALWGGLACGRGPSTSVLLITVDTLRADHLGAYGYLPPTSPAIDALAAEGALFEVAYAPMGTTSPSHATLFTGRLPLAHGLVRNGQSLSPDWETLAERLADAGFATAAFVSSFPVSRRFGFERGFEHFDDDFSGATPSVRRRRWVDIEVGGNFDRRGDETADAVEAWLAGRRDSRPLFLWVHLFDPHAPYAAPAELRALFRAQGDDADAATRADYDAEIRFADRQVARIVAAFEAAVAGEPLVVVTADHGEGLRDHGWQGHNLHLYDEEVRVPLVFRWRGRIPAGLRVAQPAHLGDLLATLTGLLELPEGDASSRGLDLSPHLTGDARSIDAQRPIWLQRPFYEPGGPLPARGNRALLNEGPGYGVRAGRWKYIEVPGVGRRELYDLERDPGEQRNVAGANARRVDELAQSLARWRAGQPALPTSPAEALSPDDLEALRALDYVE